MVWCTPVYNLELPYDISLHTVYTIKCKLLCCIKYVVRNILGGTNVRNYSLHLFKEINNQRLRYLFTSCNEHLCSIVTIGVLILGLR